jgi:aldose 1-epimerase
VVVVTGLGTVTPPSGKQYELRLGHQRAIVVEVGAAIREYSVGGRPVFDPFPVEAMADGAHGTPLVPWPNRLGGGRYTFDGVDRQLALTEPDKGNAIHGLLRWRPWRAIEANGHRAVLGARIHPEPGYPFMLDVVIEYRLGERGLEVATTATNVGTTDCPYGCGQHPYLSSGRSPRRATQHSARSGPVSQTAGQAISTGAIDEAVLTLPASTRILTDKRGLPTGREPVEGTACDFRHGKRLGTLKVDSAFTDLSRDNDGRAWARLVGADGRTAALWVDHHYPYLEIFTGDTLAPDRRRRGVGCEPMTCPPNAFASGIDLLPLEPGQSITTTWGARLL